MKLLAAEMASILAARGAPRPRVGILVRFLILLVLMVSTYAAIFKYLMASEGQEQTWVTAFYWVLTVMSTLGFGDITFHTDAGRLFSILVLMSGMLFLLVLLPFIFIEFFYQPWIARQQAARAPKALPPGTRGHVVITHLDAVAASLISRLEHYHHDYCLLVPDVEEGLRLIDLGYRIVVGPVDDPATYRAVRANHASMIVASGSDTVNTLVASTVREVSTTVPITATADDSASIDILALAECQQVLHLPSLMAAALARRVVGGDNRTHVIGNFDHLLVAEANVFGTSLIGKAIIDSQVRARSGVGIVGVWKSGIFEPAQADTVLDENTVLLLAGTNEQLAAYDEAFADCREPENSQVLILGGGRVGRLTARALEQRNISYRVVEKRADVPGIDERWIIGSAAELQILKQAGIEQATTVIITTHDDDTNVYLSLYCRKLNPTCKILSRATDTRHVASIHRAGADFVLSYASMGASQLFNSLDLGTVMIVADGLNLFRVDVPPSLHHKRLVDSAIRDRTGATVVAVEAPDGSRLINPPADTSLIAGNRLILIGDLEAEKSFIESFQ